MILNLMISGLKTLSLSVCRALHSRSNLYVKSKMNTQNENLSSAAECTDIVWMDLEMTGLDVKKDKILEVACIITDKDLNTLSEGPCFAINYPAKVYENMNDWCIKHHYESGLIDRCKSSNVTPEQAEGILLTYLTKHIPHRKCPLAGNSVYVDRMFLIQNMPLVDEYLHYRIIDVSSIKELASRWNPQVVQNAPQKKLVHRSLDDIYESISELKYYKQHLFK